ncbi:MAG: CoA transferase [Chloroflexi bacterium]|nr:CoA transferase [Chloroflexota bacterium]
MTRGNALPLSHIRVVDFTRTFAAPLATVWLAAYGAEVIKVESHMQPDTTRRLGRDESGNLAPSGDPRVAHFLAVNHSKLDVTLNLRKPEAAGLVKDLIRVSDVVVDSFSRGVMERFGLGFDDLRRLRPDIIGLGVSGFGRTGPMRDDVAYGAMATGFSGMDSLTGYEGGQPQTTAGAMDALTGIGAYCAMLMALHHRARTGEGQFIDLAMTEVQMSLVPEALVDFGLNGRVREPMGNRDDVLAPHNCYPCRGEDVWLTISVTSEEEWQALCVVMGRPDLARDPAYADGYGRWLAREALDDAVRAWTRTQSRDEAVTRLQGAGVPAAPSYSVQDIAADLHLKERGAFAEVTSKGIGTATALRLPGLVDGSPQGHYLPAPGLGEHNRLVCGEILGLPPAEVERLQRERVIY